MASLVTPPLTIVNDREGPAAKPVYGECGGGAARRGLAGWLAGALLRGLLALLFIATFLEWGSLGNRYNWCKLVFIPPPSPLADSRRSLKPSAQSPILRLAS